MQMADKYQKKCSIPLAIGRYKLKLKPQRYNCTPIKMFKIKRLIICVLVSLWRTWNTHTLLVGMQNGMTLSKHFGNFSKSWKYMYFVIWPLDPQVFTKEKKNIFSYKNSYMDIHRSSVRNNSKLEATHSEFINR